ncbi:hypothetical protein RR48_02390 [Papilio machaon]|uniref:Peptidase S1 domain-containing protein n=1 Tax=Papilio machaon TaxID=76193 RepID=A0A0N1PI87_PAPMA|nr:hypothetical protein RR48_02390 [Papilio machaon]
MNADHWDKQKTRTKNGQTTINFMFVVGIPCLPSASRRLNWRLSSRYQRNATGSWSLRKIRDGIPVDKEEKKYMVYFVKSDKSSVQYTDWVCAGALVSKLYIITAAACLEDVQYLYAVAGYTVLVEYENIDKDLCTKLYKRKVIYTCVPKAYEFDYANVEKWSAIDIGVAKVDSEFDFDKGDCSFRPQPIDINYDPKYQAAGVDAIVLGWGHKLIWKQPGDETRMVQKNLDYAPVSIINKNKCKDGYKEFPDLLAVIDKYMICTHGKGNLDIGGNIIATIKPDAEGCTNYENDHGGPLVTWIGGKEYLIGVASVFRVNNESKCEGPYLFTSTQCNGAFLNCVLNANDTRRADSICDLPARKRGFDMIHRYMSWAYQPYGRDVNEKMVLFPSQSFLIRKGLEVDGASAAIWQMSMDRMPSLLYRNQVAI